LFLSRKISGMADLRELAKQATESEEKIAFLKEQYGKLEAQIANKGGSDAIGKTYHISEEQYQLLLKVKEVLIKEQAEFEEMKSDGITLRKKNQELEKEAKRLRDNLDYKGRTLEAVTLLAQMKP